MCGSASKRKKAEEKENGAFAFRLHLVKRGGTVEEKYTTVQDPYFECYMGTRCITGDKKHSTKL